MVNHLDSQNTHVSPRRIECPERSRRTGNHHERINKSHLIEVAFVFESSVLSNVEGLFTLSGSTALTAGESRRVIMQLCISST